MKMAHLLKKMQIFIQINMPFHTKKSASGHISIGMDASHINLFRIQFVKSQKKFCSSGIRDKNLFSVQKRKHGVVPALPTGKRESVHKSFLKGLSHEMEGGIKVLSIERPL